MRRKERIIRILNSALPLISQLMRARDLRWLFLSGFIFDHLALYWTIIKRFPVPENLGKFHVFEVRVSF